MDNRVIEPMFTTTVQVLYEMGMEARIEAEPCMLPAELQKVDPFRGPLQGSKIWEIPRSFSAPGTHEISPESSACDLSLFPALFVFHTNGSSCCLQNAQWVIERGSERN